MKTISADILTPRQNAFIRAYTDASSPSFGNSYQSAVNAGYSIQTARNFMHLKPSWLSENIGRMASTIQPEQLTQTLTNIVYSDNEPTIIKLKAMEMMMKHHGMLRQQAVATSIHINVDLTGTSLAEPETQNNA